VDVVEKRSLKLGVGAGVSAFGVALTWFCCLPLAFGGFGLGAATLGAAITPLRPWFAGAALLLLGGAFHHAYRKPACGPGEICALDSNRRRQRLVVWTIGAVTVAMLTVDRWASRVIYWFL
jgi:mercuric ion transport protein